MWENLTPKEIEENNQKFTKERRERARKDYYKHRDARLAKRKQCKHKSSLDYVKKNYQNNKDKWFARMKAHQIPIGDCCMLCGNKDSLERHHPDYSKPNEFITLCRNCHKKLHRKPLSL